MEWERAKSIILFVFVIINLALAGLLFMEDRNYTLSGDRVANIHAVLSANRINLYTNPIRRFAPMRHLDVSGFYYDIPELLEIFFPPRANLDQSAGERHWRFECGYGRVLDISNGFISFDNNPEISENIHIGTPQDFVLAHFPDFIHDITFEDMGGTHIIFRQMYRGMLIYSNRIEFRIVGDSIDWIEMQFGRVLGYGGGRRHIFAPDEALLTFMQRMWYEASEEPIFITNMDIVFLQEYASDGEGQVYPAVPHYRIFIRGNEMPFLINAFTNTLLE